MRHVFSTNEVAHIWNSQSQGDARNHGNFRFRGRVLFSYAEPIARILDDGSVLLSDVRFSNTTNSHQSLARQACRNRTQIYAPYLGLYGTEDLIFVHHKNLDSFRKRYMRKAEEFEEHPRRKSCLLAMRAIDTQARTYATHFGLEWQEFTTESVREAIKEAIAASAKASAAAAERAEEQRLARMQARIEAEARFLPLWRTHVQAADMPRFWETTALRLSQDRTEIQTTHGARVPVEVAPQLWTAVQSCREHKKSWIPRVVFEVGFYRLTKIDSDGTLHIGCHTIPFSELELMAKELGYLEKAAA